MNGWIQKSEKTWIGNGNNIIKIRKSKNGISVNVYTNDYGYESGKKQTINEALKLVEWFMNRRPQE